MKKAILFIIALTVTSVGFAKGTAAAHAGKAPAAKSAVAKGKSKAPLKAKSAKAKAATPPANATCP